MTLFAQGGNRAWGALGVLAGVVAVIVVAGLIGLSSLQAERLQLDAQRTALTVLTRPRPPAKEAAKEQPIKIDPFLSEDNFALSANALQKRVVGSIESTGGRLVTVGVDPPMVGDAELARRVSVQVSAEMTNDALQKVLYQLESVPPYVFVETLSANTSEAKREPAKAGTQPAAQAAPNLVVTMSVVGYRRKATR